MSNGAYAPPAPGPEQQDAPLTEAERKMVARLFSDPTYFPLEFRTWLKNYIESGGLTFPASSIVGGVGEKSVNLPVGSVFSMPVASKAANVLLADGRSLLRDEYKALFEIYGTTFGAVDGTHFNIPDYRDRALYGVGTAVTHALTDGRGIGSRGGPRHYHNIPTQTSNPDGSHDHGVNAGASFSGSVSGSVGNNGNHYHVPGSGANFATTILNQTVPSTGSASYACGGGTGATNTTGDHSHSWSGSVSGSVSVSVDVQPGGSHTHTFSGVTSGSYDLDRPSFAAVYHYIVAK